MFSGTYKAVGFFLMFFRCLSDFGWQFGKTATTHAVSTNSFFVINRERLMFTFIIINVSFCQYKCFGDNDNSGMWKQYYYYYYSGMKIRYKGFVPDCFPYPAVRLALSLLLFFSRDDYTPSTDSTPQDNCAFKGSNFVCCGSICLYARHLWQETCVPFYIAGSQGHLAFQNRFYT